MLTKKSRYLVPDIFNAFLAIRLFLNVSVKFTRLMLLRVGTIKLQFELIFWYVFKMLCGGTVNN